MMTLVLGWTFEPISINPFQQYSDNTYSRICLRKLFYYRHHRRRYLLESDEIMLGVNAVYS